MAIKIPVTKEYPLKIQDVYFETGRSNSGNIEKFDNKRAALARAQEIADEFDEIVFIEKRTEDDLLDSFKVLPTAWDGEDPDEVLAEQERNYNRDIANSLKRY